MSVSGAMTGYSRGSYLSVAVLFGALCFPHAVLAQQASGIAGQVKDTSGAVLLSAKSQLEGNLDVYNLFNSSAALNLNSTYGSRWQFPVGASSTGPEALLWGRMVQFGGRITF